MELGEEMREAPSRVVAVSRRKRVLRDKEEPRSARTNA